MRVDWLKNSTNVRFLLPLVGAFVAGGCATGGVAPTSGSTCVGASVAICAQHGAERRCECVEHRAVRESLERLSAPASGGPFGAPSSN